MYHQWNTTPHFRKCCLPGPSPKLLSQGNRKPGVESGNERILPCLSRSWCSHAVMDGEGHIVLHLLSLSSVKERGIWSLLLLLQAQPRRPQPRPPAQDWTVVWSRGGQSCSDSGGSERPLCSDITASCSQTPASLLGLSLDPGQPAFRDTVSSSFV